MASDNFGPLRQDIHLAFRRLWRSPGFTFATILTLALGIGANVALFDVLNGVILKPLPYPAPSRLVAIQPTLRSGVPWTFSYPDYKDLAAQSKSFSDMSAWRNRGANLTQPGEATFLPIREVSASFLTTLGIEPMIGRNFSPSEDQVGAAPVALISYSLWQQRFSGNSSAVGSAVVLNGQSYTVVGVLPSGFWFFDDRPILVPIGRDNDIVANRGLHPGIYSVGRLKDGIALQEANGELTILGQHLAQAFPQTDADFVFHADSLSQQVIGGISSKLYLLFGAVGFVLLIACVNVANLFLARSVAREHEFAIRSALGAGRWRILRQLLCESLVLSLSGGLIGSGIAAVGTRWAVARLPNWLPRTNEISLDVYVLLFAVATSVLSGVVFGIVPGLQRKISLEASLRDSGRSTSRVNRIQRLFVVAEFALAFVLLTGAGLMLRTILDLWNISPGFEVKNLLTMDVALPPTDLSNPQFIRNLWRETLDRVRNTPGIVSADLDTMIPLSGDSDQIAYWTGGETAPPKNSPMAFLFTPTPDYVNTMHIRLLSGRFFTDEDRVGVAPTVVIDETLAKQLFGNSSPIGRGISVQFLGRAQIIGVVAPSRHRALDEDLNSTPQPAIYVSFFEFPDSFMPLTTAGLHLLVRTSAPPSQVANAVKKALIGPLGSAPIRNVQTMEEMISGSMAQRRGISILLGAFAVLALLLAAIGIYGVIAYTMSQRVQEVGIRMALGAQRYQVLVMVLTQAAGMVGVGLVLGTAIAFGSTRALRSVLYGVKPADPLTFGGVALVLCLVAAFAIYFPARRASQIDPAKALRRE